MADLKKTLETNMKTTKLELVPQLKPEVLDILNKQIFNELQSAQIYFGMSACFDNKGWNNAGKLFLKYGNEELTHMNKIIEYLYDKNCKVIIPGLPEVKQEYTDIREALTAALQHEIIVTKNWSDIAECALGACDATTFHFTSWFLSEQTEEENKFRDLLDLLNLGMPIWELENNVIKEIL